MREEDSSKRVPELGLFPLKREMEVGSLLFVEGEGTRRKLHQELLLELDQGASRASHRVSERGRKEEGRRREERMEGKKEEERMERRQARRKVCLLHLSTENVSGLL